MIKTEQDFREYMKGKTVPYNIMLGLRNLANDMVRDESLLFENSGFSKYSDEEFNTTRNLLLAVVAKNSYMLTMIVVKFLGIPESEIDMSINPKVTHDRENGRMIVDRGTPDWLNILNNWSVSFDPPNTTLKELTTKESEELVERAKEKAKEHINEQALKEVKTAELKKQIFDMMM